MCCEKGTVTAVLLHPDLLQGRHNLIPNNSCLLQILTAECAKLPFSLMPGASCTTSDIAVQLAKSMDRSWTGMRW